MSKVHVFNAGPCILPQAAIDATIAALQDFKGTGVSVMCMSHRSPQWGEVMDECRALWKELLHIPDTHEVVFLGGGASLQFLYVAMNFLEHKAAYLDTGVWAHKALEQAQGRGGADFFGESDGVAGLAGSRGPEYDDQVHLARGIVLRQLREVQLFGLGQFGGDGVFESGHGAGD